MNTLSMTQTDLVEQLGPSQSRIAKMEAGDPSLSIDLLKGGRVSD